MKKQKLNLKKLSLQKQTIANMKSVKGGAPESLDCGPGTSIILNCTTAGDPPAPLISIDIRQDICEGIRLSKDTLCLPCIIKF